MSNWGTTATTAGASNQADWLRRVAVVEQEMRKLKSEVDWAQQATNQLRVSHTRSDLEQAQQRMHSITESARRLCESIVQLDQLTGASSGWEASEKKGRVSRLHDQAIGEVRRLQEYSRILQNAYETARRDSLSGGGVQPRRDGEQGFDALEPRIVGGQQYQLHRIDDSETQFAEQQEREMRNLEDDITKVNEIFTTLAGLVHDQGEMVDSIEANTEAAYTQVEEGNKQLKKGVDNKNAYRKKKCCICIIIIVILAVLALILGLSLGLKNN